MEQNGVRLSVEQPVFDLLVSGGFDPLYGARPLRKAIRSAIEDPAAELILSGKLSAGGTVYAKSQDGKIVLTASEERGTIIPA